MTGTFRFASSVTVLLLAMVVTRLSLPDRTASFYYEVSSLASRVDPAINALSASIAAHPAEMLPRGLSTHSEPVAVIPLSPGRTAWQETIAATFCGSPKSLVIGVPMTSALFSAAGIGPVLISILIYYPMPLVVCAWLAERYAMAPNAGLAVLPIRSLPLMRDAGCRHRHDVYPVTACQAGRHGKVSPIRD